MIVLCINSYKNVGINDDEYNFYFHIGDCLLNYSLQTAHIRTQIILILTNYLIGFQMCICLRKNLIHVNFSINRSFTICCIFILIRQKNVTVF